MDLNTRLNELGRRIHDLETSSRVRSASISEGTTIFSRDGKLVLTDGGSLILDPGGSIAGKHWKIGTHSDGTTYADLGDVLLSSVKSSGVDKYIDMEPVSLDSSMSIKIPVPSGWDSATLIGTVNVVGLPNIKSMIKIVTPARTYSLVLNEGSSISIPIMENFISNVELVMSSTKAYSIIPHFTIVGTNDSP